MKLNPKKLIVKGLIVFSVFCGIAKSNAQTQLLLDPTQDWVGYVNVFDLPTGGGQTGNYEYGSPWGLGALTSYYNSANPPYNTLTLIANTNLWETTDTYY